MLGPMSERSARWFGSLAILLGMTVLRGCLGCGSGFESPCTDARYGCGDETEAFALDPTCALEGDLEVTLGHGESSFTELKDGEWPKIYHGSQGGTHAYLGVRVGNVALDQYDRLKVKFSFSVEHEEPCKEGYLGETTDEGHCRWVDASRELVLGHTLPLSVVDGVVEEFGLIVFVDDYAHKQLGTVEVTDPCGRTGTDTQVKAKAN